MKNFPKENKGAATLELLIAFAILILNITAVMLLLSGGQSIYVDSETNTEAIGKAKKILEEAQAAAKEDFSDVVSETLSDEDIYERELLVEDLTPCKKELESNIAWSVSPTRPLTINFSTIVTDIQGLVALGGDCDLGTTMEWDNPVTADSIGIGGAGATDIDVQNNMIYLSSDPSAVPKEDFFIYEFDPLAPSLSEKSSINVSSGLSALDYADGFVYAANNETTYQLIVLKVDDELDPSIETLVSLPGMTTGHGRSIYFYDDMVYIGTEFLACPPSCLSSQNNEFHVFDVSEPGDPEWKGSFDVNHNINDIVVRGDYAYLATSGDDREIVILDVSEPDDISPVGVFNAQDVPSGAGEDATSLYLMGDKLYFGRKRAPSTRPDFYVINVEKPSLPSLWGSRNLGMNPGSTTRVTGIIVRGKLAFVGMDDPNFGLKIIDISSPSLPYHYTCTTLNFSENSTALDMDGDFIFSANDSNDEIRVIKDQLSICPAP